MNTKALVAAAMTVGLGLAAGPVVAHASPIAFDQWYEYRWNGPAPALALACSNCAPLGGGIGAPLDSPWTISGNVKLRVTDAFDAIDQFEVFDFGVSQGITSGFFGPGPSCYSGTVEDCFADPNFSHGEFYLGGGAHSITIYTTPGSSALGAAFFRAETAVPEPASLLLLGTGLAAAAARRRFRPRT